MVHSDHEQIHASNALVQDAAGVATDVTGHIGMHIRHEGVKRASSVVPVELAIVGPIDCSIEQLRVPAAIPRWATTAAALTLFHQTVDKFFIFAAETFLAQFLAGQILQSRNDCCEAAEMVHLATLDSRQHY